MARAPHRWLREPLVHFVVLGALLAWAHHTWVARPVAPVIEVGPELLAALAAEHAARHGAAPTEPELAAARDRWVRDEALYREAMALGLDRDDAIVRRRLIQKMELVLAASLPAPDIDDAQRRAYLEAHPETFVVPARRSIDVRFFGSGRADAAADAAAAREVLARGQDVAGDPLLASAGWQSVSRDELARGVGEHAAEALFGLPSGAWSDPIVLPTGVLVARVIAEEPETMPELSVVAARIDAAILGERSDDALDAAIDEVVARHTGSEAP